MKWNTGLTARTLMVAALIAAGANAKPQAMIVSGLPSPIPGAPGTLVTEPVAADAGAGSLGQIVLELEIVHESVCDLALTLHYDSDNDGQIDASVPVVLAIPERDVETGSQVWTCPLSLDGAYRFEFPSEMQRESFEGMRAGGAFQLEVADCGPGSRGTLSRWDIETELIPNSDYEKKPNVIVGSYCEICN